MEISAETIQDQIPYYLTREQKEGLVRALQSFPSHFEYYIQQYPNEMLQGDGWAGLEVIRFEDLERSRIRGIVLSNTCDLDPSNSRDLPTQIVFAPIIRLSRFADVLRSREVPQGRIDRQFDAIRAQKVTAMFYLPEGGCLEDEHVALLNDLHTVPAEAFRRVDERKKLFTLSLVGFYLFLLKLSVHFCRFHENVPR